MSGAGGPIVVALGGNALQGGANVYECPALPPACRIMAEYADDGLVVTHGNGPQVGGLAESAGEQAVPMDVLGAQTEGMIGYMIEQELGNWLESASGVVTLLTRTEVSADDPDLEKPVKPVGEWIDAHSARRFAAQNGWSFEKANGRYRRLVPSPQPMRTLQLPVLERLVGDGYVVICAGGGGIPVTRGSDARLRGVDAVIDKDRTSALLAGELAARLLVLATDVPGVYRDWNGTAGELIGEGTPESMRQLNLPPGSMGPKVEAACGFVERSGTAAVIGSVGQLRELIACEAGTVIRREAAEGADDGGCDAA